MISNISPFNLFVDSNQNTYFTDSVSNKIGIVDPTGNIVFQTSGCWTGNQLSAIVGRLFIYMKLTQKEIFMLQRPVIAKSIESLLVSTAHSQIHIQVGLHQ